MSKHKVKKETEVNAMEEHAQNYVLRMEIELVKKPAQATAETDSDREAAMDKHEHHKSFEDKLIKYLATLYPYATPEEALSILNIRL